MITPRVSFVSLCLIVVVAGCSGSADSEDGASSPSSSPSPEEVQDDLGHSHGDEEDPPPVSEASLVVEGFAAAFADVESPDWHEEVAAYTTEHLGELYALTDPSTIPFTDVDGDAELTDPPEGEEANEYRSWWAIRTSEQPLVVEVVAAGDQWQVAGTDLGQWHHAE